MKKKLLLCFLSLTMCAGAVSTVAVFNNSTGSYVNKDAMPSGTFVLDEDTIAVEEDYYTAVALDDSSNRVMSKFVGMQLNSETHKLMFAKSTAGWFTNVEPVRGFDAITFSFDVNASVIGALYFSYNELNVTNIFAGKYQDLVCLPFTYCSTSMSITSKELPQMLDARYVLFLLQNVSNTVDISIDGLSFDSHCADEPAEQEIGTVTDFKQEYKDAAEAANIDLWSGFILANGSYTFRVAPMVGGYEIVSVQNMNGLMAIMQYVTINGFIATLTEQDESSVHIYYQKERAGEETPYTIALNIMMGPSYYYIDSYFTTMLPYVVQDEEWPREKLAKAGASEELLDAFDPFNIPNVTYMFQTSYSTIQEKNFLVAVTAKTGTFDPVEAKEAVDAYKAKYEADSNYSVTYNDYSNSFTIRKIGTRYAIYISPQSDYSMITVELMEYNLYDHLPFAEYKEYLNTQGGRGGGDIIPVEFTLSGDFDASYAPNQYIGYSVDEDEFKAFIDSFVAAGYTFAGSYTNGQIIATAKRFIEYNSRFDFSFSKVEDNTYMINVNAGTRPSEYNNVSSALEHFQNSSSNTTREIIDVAINSGSEMLNQDVLSYYAGTGEYNGEYIIMKGVGETAISDFMAMFNDEKLSVTKIRDEQYKVTLVDADDEKDIGRSIYFQFDTFFVGEYRNVSISFANDSLTYGDTYDKNYQQVNAQLSDNWGYVQLPANSYKYDTTDNAFSTLGTLEEITILERQYTALVEASGKFAYDDFSETYYNPSNHKSVKIEISTYVDNLFKLQVVYYSNYEVTRDFDTYEDAGLANYPFINEAFGPLPHLTGEKAYKIVSESETEVAVAVNNKFDIYNYYVFKTLRDNGFNNNIKSDDNYRYRLETRGNHYGSHTVYYFIKRALVSLDDLVAALTNVNAAHVADAFELSDEWKYLISSGPGDTYMSITIFGISYHDFKDRLESYNIPTDEYFIRGDYRYIAMVYTGNGGVSMNINWHPVDE